MKRERMLPRVVMGAVRHRAMRVAVAALSVAVGASLVAALANVSLDIGSKAGKELRSYGANMVLTPRLASGETGLGNLDFGAIEEEGYLEQARTAELGSWSDSGLLAYAPYLVGTAQLKGSSVTLVGAEFQQVRGMRPWWSVNGTWADQSTDSGGATAAMIGIDLARALGVQTGSTFEIDHGAERLEARLAGIVETGGDEDHQLFVPLTAAQQLLDRRGLVSSVEISATAEERPLRELAGEIEQRMGGTRVRVIGQIADAEASSLGKVQALMGLVAILVLVASGLAVASTMAASVMERTREIGLMRALGAGSGQVAMIFLAEATIIALLGGAPGYLLGLGITQAVGRAVFDSGIAPSLLAIPLTGAVALATCIAASLLPIRRALSVDPALTLRGE